MDAHRQLDLTGFHAIEESEESEETNKLVCTIQTEDSAILDIPAAHEKLCELIGKSEIKGRHTWSAKGFKFIPSRHNLEFIERNFPVEFVNLELRKKDTFSLPDSYSGIYESNTVSFPHQVDALKFALQRKQFGLFMEQGTGKTKVLLDYAGTLFEDDIVDCCIVVAPKGVHRQWIESEVPKHLGCNYQAIYWNGRVEFMHRHEHALLIYAFNYDAMRTIKAQQQIELILDTFETPMLILDESHKVKNSSSLRWKGINEHLASKCEIKAALTGTPIAKNLVDEWAQLYLVNKDIIGLDKRQHFIDEYCYSSGRYGSVISARNVDKFKRITKDHVFRLKKTDLDIEEKTYSKWHFDMSRKQLKMYKEVLHSILISLQELADDESQHGELIVRNHLVRMMKLQQISNGWIKDSEGNTVDLIPFNQNPRIEAMLECIESKEDQQVLIWCRFNHDVTTIGLALEDSKISYVAIDGRTNNKEIPALTEKFFSGNARVMVSTPAKLGTGYNLQVGGCVNAIYYSNSENSIDRWQSEDRIHRIGTKGICNYTDIIGTNTRDSTILANLQSKKNLADYVLDDIINELTELENDFDR